MTDAGAGAVGRGVGGEEFVMGTYRMTSDGDSGGGKEEESIAVRLLVSISLRIIGPMSSGTECGTASARSVPPSAPMRQILSDS